jgi:site-specific DNA-methyltransferase (adenine-specific)
VETEELRGKKYNNQNTGWKCTSKPSVQIGHDTGRFPANLIHDGSQEVLDLFPSAGKDSAARFFYCAKASKKDRDEGLPQGETSSHPTVKPTALMQYLCRLITPPGGIVLDPYMGSGSTGKAAIKEGFGFIGCELDPNYYEIARARVAQASDGGRWE